MRQIALPLPLRNRSAPRIVVGNANAAAVDALADADRWPFRTAVLSGQPHSGKTLLGRWFAQSGKGDTLDDADQMDEARVFHVWNRAQENGRPLLIIRGASTTDWQIRLPDLASRIGSALHLEIGPPDDAMMAELIALHAEMRSLPLDPAGIAYLVSRCERSHVAAGQVVAAIDRLSLERKQPPTLSIWREALNEITGSDRSAT